MDVHEALALIRETPRAMLRAPRQWSRAQWAAATALLVAIVAAYVEKRWIEAHTPRADLGMPVVWVAEVLGGGGPAVTLGLALLVSGLVLRRAAWVETAVVLAAGGLPCFVLTHVGQLVLAEARPREGGAMHFFATDGHGVSGHASGSALLFFPLVVVAAQRMARPYRVVLAIGLAAWIALVAGTRMALGMHFAWNVILGLAIGLFCGHTAAHVWRERAAAKASAGRGPRSSSARAETDADRGGRRTA
jgi:membrane-associated phospholipid phosphatase